MRSGHALRAVLAVVATLLTVGIGRAADVTIRFSTAAPPSDFLAKSLEAFKAEVEGANVGVKVETHPASTLFRQGTEVPALQRGNLEMSTMTTFEVAQQMAEYGLFNRAYLFRDYDHLRGVFDGAIGATYRRAVADKMGIEILSVAYLGTRQVNLRQKRNVKGPADLAGIKMRMPAGPEWLLLGKAIGVSPVPLGMPEVYLALKTGSIDGQENPLSLTRANNLHEVTQQIVLTSHLVQPVFLTIGKPVWDKLSEAQKDAVRKAARAGADYNDKNRLDDEAKIVAFFKERGLQVITPDVAAFRSAVAKSYAESDLAKAWPQGLKERIESVR